MRVCQLGHEMSEDPLIVRNYNNSNYGMKKKEKFTQNEQQQQQIHQETGRIVRSVYAFD